MKTRINKKPKETAKKYIKYLAYFMYFYFGWRLIITPLIFIVGREELDEVFGGTLWFIFNLIIGICFAIFGLISAYNLTKFKRWALISLTILVALHAISIAINTLVLGKLKIPIVQIAILIFIIEAFKHLKNAQ